MVQLGQLTNVRFLRRATSPRTIAEVAKLLRVVDDARIGSLTFGQERSKIAINLMTTDPSSFRPIRAQEGATSVPIANRVARVEGIHRVQFVQTVRSRSLSNFRAVVESTNDDEE